MKELVSIIMPVYNCDKYVVQAIESVLNQTYANIELIIINDNSKDNSINIINKYKEDARIKVIDLKQNVGAANARNKGIEIANGRYIAFLDADDFWSKDKLEKQIDFMKKNESDFCFTGFYYTYENGKPKKEVLKVPEILSYKKALKNTIILTSTVIIDTNKIKKELIFMPNVGSEDMATWWKILKNGFIAKGLKETLTYHRTGMESLSKNKIVSAKRTWKLYREVEKISFVKSVYYFINYAVRATLKRI